MIVFTNGCFDILHIGHIRFLQQARSLGTRLIVGLNSDESVRRIKGDRRPVFSETDRKETLLALNCVDEVRIFNELTPERLITEISPDILVKGGDWKENEIIGADIVRSKGGKVISIPLVKGYSTTSILESITNRQVPREAGQGCNSQTSLIEHFELFEKMLTESVDASRECSELLISTLKNGGKIFLCGNGGSAADAQHFAAELVGRFERDRIALAAIALTTDTSALTAISNDIGFESVYSRQLEAIARSGDCLVALSTSGVSPNIVDAVMTARRLGCKIVAMTGAKGKKLAALSDACLMVPSFRTARIQEMHIAYIHSWCEQIENEFVSTMKDQ